MILLAVDTSHAKGSLALADSDRLLGEVSYLKKAMHSEVVTLELEKLLRDGGRALEDVTHVAVNVGPGSFTGLRVGINLARTLAYLRGLPVAAVSSLELLARRAATRERTLVAIRAIQNFHYAAAYEGGEELLAPRSVTDPEAEARRLNCTKVLIEGLTPAFGAETRAAELALGIGSGALTPRFFSWENLKPLYVRASEAEEKLRRGLLKPV